MAFSKLRDRLNREHAERVFLAAQRALFEPQPFSISLAAAYVLSGIILLLPVAIALLGVWVVFAAWFNLLATFFGLLLVGLGYVLFPSAVLNKKKTFRPSDFPEFFRLIGAVSDAIGTPPPDGLQLLQVSNAFAGRYGRLRKENILGIGVPLWRMLTPQERIGLLAHEMAHFVNDDPARGSITGAALQTVAEWDQFLAVDYYVDDYSRTLTETLVEFVQFVLRLPILCLGWVLLLLQFNRSQRAEYLADGLAAQVAGPDAMIGSLRKIQLLPLAEKAIDTLYPFRKDQNGRIFDVMAKAVIDPEPQAARKLDQDAAEQKQRVDDSHPPTVYRIGFLQALGPIAAKLSAADFDFEKIDREIAQESDRLGKRLMQAYEDRHM